MKNQIRVYVSHSIRGKKGKDATHEDIRHSVDLAIVFGQALRRKFPGVYFYVPADHELPPVGNLLDKKYISIDQILEIDCDIVKKSHFVVAYSPAGYLSTGMKKEIECAGINSIPVIEVARLDDAGIATINHQLHNFIR